MASDDYLRRPLLDFGTSRETSYVKYTASPTSSTTVNLLSDSFSKVDKKNKKDRKMNKKFKKPAIQSSSTGNLREKLSTRKHLQGRL